MNETIYTTEVSCRVAAVHLNVFYVLSTFADTQKKNRIWNEQACWIIRSFSQRRETSNIQI